MDTMIDTLTMNGQTLFSDLDDVRFDPVTKPSHYNIGGGMECIDMIKERGKLIKVKLIPFKGEKKVT